MFRTDRSIIRGLFYLRFFFLELPQMKLPKKDLEQTQVNTELDTAKYEKVL